MREVSGAVVVRRTRKEGEEQEAGAGEGFCTNLKL